MKIAVCTNFALPHHMGGSERISDLICDYFSSELNHDVELFFSMGQPDKNPLESYKYKNYLLNYIPDSNLFLNKIKTFNPDHIFIYGDYFSHFKELLKLSNSNFKYKMSLAPVGANYLYKNQNLISEYIIPNFKNNSIISHSILNKDYALFNMHNISPIIIKNPIDFAEINNISNLDYSARQKYGILGKKIILCVSNFFPGKGQIEFLDVINKFNLENKNYNDYCFVFVSTCGNFNIQNFYISKFKSKINSLNIKNVLLLTDIPREDVLKLFEESHLFVLPSLSEVSPLVILECMGFSLPWVSLDVGNVFEFSGGIVISDGKSNNNNQKYNEDLISRFCSKIEDLLFDEHLHRNLKIESRNKNHQYDWNNIKKQYRKIFNA